MVHTRYDNRRHLSFISFIHSQKRPTVMGKHVFVPYWVRWERTFFSYVAERAIPKNKWHTPLAPMVFYIFPIAVKHRFPSDHTGPEWFSTRRRTIHPLDAWTPVSIGSHWARVIQHPPTHHPSTGCLILLWMNLNLSRAQPAHASPPSLTDWLKDRLAELIYKIK